jgi:hypothetical protein
MMAHNVINPTMHLGVGLLVLSGLLMSACSGGGYDSAAASTGYTYSISGLVAGGATDHSGVTITLTGGTAKSPFITAAGGSYSFTGLANGTYTVTPSLASYTFTPSSAMVTVYGGNMTTNFAEAP